MQEGGEREGGARREGGRAFDLNALNRSCKKIPEGKTMSTRVERGIGDRNDDDDDCRESGTLPRANPTLLSPRILLSSEITNYAPASLHPSTPPLPDKRGTRD